MGENLLSFQEIIITVNSQKQSKPKKNKTELFFFFFPHMEKGEGSLSGHFEVIPYLGEYT